MLTKKILETEIDAPSEMTLEEINAEIYLARREREFREYTEKVWREMNETDRISLLNDNSELTLEEINAEIEAVRDEMEARTGTRNIFRVLKGFALEAAHEGRPLTVADFLRASAESHRKIERTH